MDPAKPAKTGTFKQWLSTPFRSKKKSKTPSYSNAILARFIPNDHELKTAMYMEKTVNFDNTWKNYYFDDDDSTIEGINQYCTEKKLENWNFTWEKKSILQKAIHFQKEDLFTHIITHHPYLKDVGDVSPITRAIWEIQDDTQGVQVRRIYRFITILITLGTDINRGCINGTPLDLAVERKLTPLIDIFVFSGGCFYEGNLSKSEKNIHELRASVSRLYEIIRLLYVGAQRRTSVFSTLPKEINRKLIIDKIRLELFSPILNK